MAVIFKAFRGKAEEMPVARHDGYIYYTTDEGKFYIDAANDGIIERRLINPDVTSGAISKTTAEWNATPALISQKNIFYIYTDYQQTEQGKNIPGIKVGDGTSYLIDLPFVDSMMLDHINNSTIHITAQQRQFWNNKVRCYYSEVENEKVIFTTL